MRKVEPDAGSFISTATMLPFYLAIAFANGEIFLIPNAGYYFLLLFAAQGVIHYVLGRTINWNAVRIIGAARASQINKTETIFTVVLGFLLLSDPVTIPIALGAFAIFVGAIIVAGSQMKGAAAQTQTYGSFGRGVLYGALAGLAWGSSPLLIREGLRTLRMPIGGGLVAASSGVLGLIILLLAKGRLSRLTSIPWSSMKYVLLVGLIYSLATVSRILALLDVPSTVFGPIQGTTPLFTLLFAYLFTKRGEALNVWVWTGALFTIGGSYLIIFS